jgi:prepilin-type N-terminal cleavage/methylation domain-containing protein
MSTSFFSTSLPRVSTPFQATSLERGFTLLELLLVIGILGIMGGITVVVINPGELLKEARDTTRLADLRSVNTALFTYTTQKGEPGGNPNYLYISLPDATATCNTFLASLPTLPFPYEYRCSTSADYRKTDGTGWIPVAFSSIPGGSPIPTLPVDPVNAGTSYYTYMSGGSYEVTALFEAERHDAAIDDDGFLPGVLELGTHIGLTPATRDLGLVGYWGFDEGSGSAAYDYSGNENEGTILNNPIRRESSFCGYGKCLEFDGIDDYVKINLNTIFNTNADGEFTYTTWIKSDSYAARQSVLTRTSPCNNPGHFDIYVANNAVYFAFYSNLEPGLATINTDSILTNGQPYHIAWSRKWGQMGTKFYLNGVPFVIHGDSGRKGTTSVTDIFIGARNGDTLTCQTDPYPFKFFDGLIDDVRIYNRVLSLEEIQVIQRTTTE